MTEDEYYLMSRDILFESNRRDWQASKMQRNGICATKY